VPSQVSGLSGLLKSNLERGINSNEEDLLKRRDLFGANTYPRKKRKGIWVHSFPYVS
jgi:Ca2+-transporting ATPase